MRKIVSLTLAMGLLLLFPLTSKSAITVSGLFNTGESVTVGPPDTDNAWSYSYAGPTTGAAVVSSPKPPSWVANDANSQWVSVNEKSVVPGNVNVTYKLSFTVALDVPGDSALLPSIKITGMWAADDNIVDVLINGVSTGDSMTGDASANYRFLHAFSISSDKYVEGVNTLEIETDDSGKNVSGLRIDDIDYSVASGIPEPGTLAIWGLLSLIGLAVVRRKRRA